MILRDPALGEYLESSWFWESGFLYGLVYNAIQDQPSFHKPDLLRGDDKGEVEDADDWP